MLHRICATEPLYWETRRYDATGADRPALKNTVSAFTGAAPRRLDHLNLLATDVTEFRRFMETCLGSRVTEMIRLDNGRIGGCWFTINNKTYDLACTEEHGGGPSTERLARLHHVTYATDQREDILRAADAITDREAATLDPIGVDGWLVGFGARLTEPANRAALAFRAAVEAADLPGLTETAAALTSVLVRFDLGATDHAATRAALAMLLAARDWHAAPLPAGRRLWRVPAMFGNAVAPQLGEAAARAGLTPAAAVAALCAAPLWVQTVGFAPGQPYLGQLPPAWDLARQPTLTPRVPEGALVVAIRQAVVFAIPSPIGWRHVGQTALALFRPDRPDPFLLRPGDAVLFEAVGRAALDRLRAAGGGAVAEPLP
ncbi:MAG: carboxyltransferase domain-containing protein [Gemmobacter sp.]